MGTDKTRRAVGRQLLGRAASGRIDNQGHWRPRSSRLPGFRPRCSPISHRGPTRTTMSGGNLWTQRPEILKYDPATSKWTDLRATGARARRSRHYLAPTRRHGRHAGDPAGLPHQPDGRDDGAQRGPISRRAQGRRPCAVGRRSRSIRRMGRAIKTGHLSGFDRGNPITPRAQRVLSAAGGLVAISRHRGRCARKSDDQNMKAIRPITFAPRGYSRTGSSTRLLSGRVCRGFVAQARK